MPANPKHLTSSGWQQFAKVSSGILGGYFVSTTLHLALAIWTNHKVVLITSLYSIFILWVVLLILPFLFKNGWKAWILYTLLILIFGVMIYYGKLIYPIV